MILSLLTEINMRLMHRTCTSSTKYAILKN
jgi:hypothetical protein